jgi:hypothetical protein
MPEHADAFIVRSPKTESVEKLDGCQQEGEIVGERQQSSAEPVARPHLCAVCVRGDQRRLITTVPAARS